VIFGETGRQDCLDFIEKNWTDMQPRSVIKAMEADASARQNGTAAERNGATKKQSRSAAPKMEAAAQ
jgi:hypothetical protein